MSWSLPSGYHTQVALANYVPGPLNPPDYYWEPRILDCGHSEEDCDGIECGNGIPEVPADYDFWQGVNPGQYDPDPDSPDWRDYA